MEIEIEEIGVVKNQIQEKQFSRNTAVCASRSLIVSSGNGHTIVGLLLHKTEASA